VCQSVIGNLIGQAIPLKLLCFCLYICVPSRVGERRGACRVLLGRPEGKRPLGRPRLRWESNVRMDLKTIVREDEDCIDLARDRDKWRVLVTTAMFLRVP